MFRKHRKAMKKKARESFLKMADSKTMNHNDGKLNPGDKASDPKAAKKAIRKARSPEILFAEIGKMRQRFKAIFIANL